MYVAFLKARQYNWENAYYDTVEVRLFEWQLSRNLQELAADLKRGYRFSPLVRFTVPKKRGESRPYAYRNFRDDVASIALILALQPRIEKMFDSRGRVSFGNRLASIRFSDALFRDWKTAWTDFMNAARSAGGRYRFCAKTDIRRFYPTVREAQLNAILRQTAPGDPAVSTLERMISGDGPGLPAGPGSSAVLANILLDPFDKELLNGWKLRGRYMRYVDDMYLFGSNAREIHSLFGRVQDRLWEKWRLATHRGKVKVDRSGSLLKPVATPASWIRLSHDFERILTSLYHVPPEYHHSFLRAPERTLRAYTSGLRAAGIYVSGAWLAQRFLAERGRHGSRDPWSSYEHLRFPGLDLNRPEESGRGWAAAFRKMNGPFFKRLASLRGRLLRGFSAKARAIRPTTTDLDRLKPVLFHLKFYASRLAVLDCRPADAHFEKFLDHPWALEPAITASALMSAPDAVPRFISVMFSRRDPLVRARAAWALGELGAARAVPELWRTAHPGHPHLVRRAAYESILRFEQLPGVDPRAVLHSARVERDPAIRKFLYLLIGRMRVSAGAPLLRDRASSERDFFARRAAEYALQAQSIFSHHGAPARHIAPFFLPTRTRSI